MRPLESLFFIALALYSVAIWADWFNGALKRWMIWTFGLALCADTAGTFLLCMNLSGAFRVTLHTVSGAASLLIMALHFTWAVLAVRRGERYERLFRRWSLLAWAIWLVSFLSGAFIR